MSIKKIYHAVVPEKLQEAIDYKRRKHWYTLSRIIEKYYRSHPFPKGAKESLSFLRKNHFNLDKYKLLYLSNIVEGYLKEYKNIAILIDKKMDLPYVLHDGKPLYFPRGSNDNTIRETYAQFLSEMDIESPHLYCKNPEELQNRVLFDCGVAEGLFPLTYIDYFNKIVLFECEPAWIEPLSATFAPYKEKVIIVNSYVSDSTTDHSVSLDYYAEANHIWPTFIKMDIEGFEERALAGASKILDKSSDLICAICTYHKPNSESDIVNYMQKKGFSPSYNKGFMFFFYEKKITPPYLRHGVVRFYKKNEV